MARNEFSREWYETFLDAIASENTAAEVAFVERQLPLEEFPALLDVCCGPGRHANPLAARGYRVLGVDANAEVVARAEREAPSGASFHLLDMRALDSLGERFDGVTNLWHSFGYFDDATNQAVLRQMGARLRPGGRLLIDLYNRDHIATLPLFETYERGGKLVKSSRSWSGRRHKVELAYDAGGRDEFEWRLYTPSELTALAAAAGLRVRLSCAWFRDSLPPSAEYARMQFVLEPAS
ncbi:MAG TPA: class I SAM-dependent methyltransferase [Myxococcota bacterium]|nr:class I SAM-dependent methyltransferase [Myxococcota bacterium]